MDEGSNAQTKERTNEKRTNKQANKVNARTDGDLITTVQLAGRFAVAEDSENEGGRGVVVDAF